MPIYEYKCRKCGKDFELFQRMTDPAVKSCQFCKGPVQKLMSLSSFHLKGSGWYATDYGGKKAPAVENKVDTKTESTPAPAAEKSPATTTAAKSED
jgi:putative FmdB family regulatory protein